MSNLIRWNPIREMLTMNEAMDRLFDNAFVVTNNGSTRGKPAFDLIEQGNNYIVKAELPGFAPDKIDVRVEGNTLTLHGEVSSENEKKEEGQYHIRERQWSSFTRSVALPTAVDADKTTADYDNGILTLTLPKHEALLRKKITIAAKPANGNKDAAK